jgi:hypothetical protein
MMYILFYSSSSRDLEKALFARPFIDLFQGETHQTLTKFCSAAAVVAAAAAAAGPQLQTAAAAVWASSSCSRMVGAAVNGSVIFRCIVKFIYVENLKRLIIWNGGREYS